MLKRNAGRADNNPDRLLSELGSIKEVINIYPPKRGQKTVRKQTVLSRTSELQEQLLRILGIEKQGNNTS